MAAERATLDYRLGLALSGGAVRGAAHIGVLRALRELDVRPDIICGTSSGALVGTMWSMGLKDEEMRQAMLDFSPLSLWYTNWSGPSLLDPSSFTSHWAELLAGELEDGTPPVWVVATDLQSGEPILMFSGARLPALQASCALAPFWPPVSVGERLLFDGGYSLNVPVEPIRSLCQTVIAVDVNPHYTADDGCCRSSWRVFNRGMEIVGRRSNERSLALADVVVEPEDLHRFDPLDTRHVSDVEDLGYRAAHAQIGPIAQQLRRGVVPEQHRRRPRPRPLRSMVVPNPPALVRKERRGGSLGWWMVGAGLLGAGLYLEGSRRQRRRRG
ncbi:MAG: patatin-like phospholipase family protein [Myxococcota bacterium]